MTDKTVTLTPDEVTTIRILGNLYSDVLESPLRRYFWQGQEGVNEILFLCEHLPTLGPKLGIDKDDLT